MTWSIFDNVHVWKLCVLSFIISLTLSKLSQLPNLELDSLLSGFDGSLRTLKIYKWVYKTNIDCSFIQGMVENYCTVGKIQSGLLLTLALRASANSRPRLKFTLGTIIFHHSPHEQSIFV